MSQRRPTLPFPDTRIGAGLKCTGICSWATPGNSTVLGSKLKHVYGMKLSFTGISCIVDVILF